jgi:protein-disulfide isomerase
MSNHSRTGLHERWLTPLSVLIGSLVISASILYAGKPQGTPSVTAAKPQIKIDQASSKDHVLGNLKAKVLIVEYSDIECPFCKRLHATLHDVMDAYGKEGEVAWVFRHFPVHRNSVKEAEAVECAAELGGNEAFWRYIDRIFELTPSNDGLDLAKLPIIAREIGLDAQKFSSCLSSGKYKEKIEAQKAQAMASGARGTPWSVMITDNTATPIAGAASYEKIESMIKEALGKR